uniref:Uncharacterized protein n=1 Tax=Chromera velia CCMP2878 TaxID=1169474 RepID=A0A0G4FR93_9ALVE|eukprot:Cvel_18248.t1-p1 / transcript=Cvel_18248.t1 / gene=Cvel_18248 / organism=Chromera_velia_CCMP2878 / gene_product=hypothetical protein / transcript_product=hypothetical protein / location=Cvel_scaffold1501:24187-24540(+) / protein_length=118 / sequence_SO=supercontig / SO=protein_coding / is_pseudo=false
MALDLASLPVLSEPTAYSSTGKTLVVFANAALLLGFLLIGSYGGLRKVGPMKKKWPLAYSLRVVGVGGAYYFAWWSLVPVVDGKREGFKSHWILTESTGQLAASRESPNQSLWITACN